MFIDFTVLWSASAVKYRKALSLNSICVFFFFLTYKKPPQIRRTFNLPLLFTSSCRPMKNCLATTVFAFLFLGCKPVQFETQRGAIAVRESTSTEHS
jgi:hypothetical protein